LPELSNETQQELAAMAPQRHVCQFQVLIEEQAQAAPAVKEKVQTDSDDDADAKLSVTTDNIPWYTAMGLRKSYVNGSVEMYKTEMGEEMMEDDDAGME
jgi:hypothetical protein